MIHFPGIMIHFPGINESFSRNNDLFSLSFYVDQCMKMNQQAYVATQKRRPAGPAGRLRRRISTSKLGPAGKSLASNEDKH